MQKSDGHIPITFEAAKAAKDRILAQWTNAAAKQDRVHTCYWPGYQRSGAS